MNNEACCPKIDPKRWDKKSHNWKNKLFIKEWIPTLFHTPFPPMIEWKMTKMWNAAEKAKAIPPDTEDILILFFDPHAFKSEIYLTVAKEVPGAENIKISGTFMSRVFDGPYNDIPKFMKEMDKYLVSKGKKSKKYYVHYAYCPGCAKRYKHNYMILFAEV
jgi:hypothetical protein